MSSNGNLEQLAADIVRRAIGRGTADAECTIVRLGAGLGVLNGRQVPVGVGIPTIKIDRMAVGGTSA